LDPNAAILFLKFIPVDTLISLTASIPRDMCLSLLDLDWVSVMIGRTSSITGQRCTSLLETRPKISVFRMLATNFVSDPDNFSENGPNVHLAGHGKDKVASSKSK
jgi:hypothetical protein